MANAFKGTINLDIRESRPDWEPFEAPRAPEGMPDVVYIVLSLYMDDKKVGEGRIKTQPGDYGLGSAVTVGRSDRMVADDYPGERPWRFTGGTIKFVAVDVSDEPYVDLERAAVAMLARE